MFELEPLPYHYEALEPYIDGQTMQIHHDKHHAAYINNLNQALSKHPELDGILLDDLLIKLEEIPVDIRSAVRNHGGGAWNHNLFWKTMVPNGGGTPEGNLMQKLSQDFESFENFQKEFSQMATSLFGSGWVWLIKAGDELKIITTQNQDNPLTNSFQPILGLDVWEHAYYLKYQNRRGEYVNNWWNLINWEEVSRRFEE